MRTLLLFDQVQAGYGGKERGDTELGLEKGRWVLGQGFWQDLALATICVDRIIFKRTKKR